MLPLEIQPYSPHFELDVIDLILEIQQQEFDIPIDLSRQPDLMDIPNFYQKGEGNFWVAIVDGKVVGTIALLDIGNKAAALRKMFVKAEYRGAWGVGQKLLGILLAWVQQKGLEAVYLGTTEKFLAAQRFYEKNGFEAIDKAALPTSFPVMTVDVKFYRLVVQNATHE